MLSPEKQIENLKEKFPNGIPLVDFLQMSLEVLKWNDYPYEYFDQYGVRRKMSKQEYLSSILNIINNG